MKSLTKGAATVALSALGCCSQASETSSLEHATKQEALAVLEVTVQILQLKDAPGPDADPVVTLPRYSLLMKISPEVQTGAVNGIPVDWIKVRNRDGKVGFTTTIPVRELTTFDTPPPETFRTDIECSSAGCASVAEKTVLRQFPDLFQRSDRVLRVSLIGERTVELVDSQDLNVDTAVVYRLSNYYIEPDLVLLETRRYEGGKFLLLSRKTGKELKLWSKPVFSPSGKYLLTCFSSFAYESSGIQIVEIKPGPPRIIYESSDIMYPANCAWKTDERITFIQNTHTELGWVRQERFLFFDRSSWWLGK